MRADNFYIALVRPGPPDDQLPVLRRHGRHGHPRPGRVGAHRRGQRPRLDRLRPANRPSDADHSGRLRGARRQRRGRAGRRQGQRRLAGRSPVGGRPDARRARRPGLLGRGDLHRGGPRPAGVRGPARRHRAQPCPRRSRRRGSATPSSRWSTRSATPSRSQLDFQAIIDLVGERVRRVFDSQSMFIALYDEPSGTITFPYEIDEGTRIQSDPIPFGAGLTSHRHPARGSRCASRPPPRATRWARSTAGRHRESWLGVPILTGDRVIGVLALESHRRSTPSTRATERLLGTLATSMGAALENARLFDETKRLLADADERAAELAVINEIGEALVAPARVRRDHRARRRARPAAVQRRSIFIALHDPATNLIDFPYDLDEGEAFHRDAVARSATGLTSTVIRIEPSAARSAPSRSRRPPGHLGRRHRHLRPGWASRSLGGEPRHRRDRARERRGGRVQRRPTSAS